MPDLSEKGLKWMRENCEERPRISLGWMGPFISMVNVVHPETVKTILKGSGKNLDWLQTCEEGVLSLNVPQIFSRTQKSQVKI